MGAPKTGGQIVGYCAGFRGARCGRPLAARKYCQQLGAWENHGNMRCPACARRTRLDVNPRGFGTGAWDGRVHVYPPPGEWVAEALCAQVDPDLHFPEKGGTSLPAKLICRGCPVVADCLRYALDNGVREGVWGGQTWHERRRLLGVAA